MDGELIYSEVYDTSVVQDTFKKLGMLLSNMREWLISYIENAKVSKII